MYIAYLLIYYFFFKLNIDQIENDSLYKRFNKNSIGEFGYVGFVIFVFLVFERLREDECCEFEVSLNVV